MDKKIEQVTKAISQMTENEIIQSMDDGQWDRWEQMPEWMTARQFVIIEIVTAIS